MEGTWKILRSADDITPEMEGYIHDTVDWFEDEPTMPTEDFIDRFCETYGGNGVGPDDFDIDNLDTPAVRKIMRIARDDWRERRGA